MAVLMPKLKDLRNLLGEIEEHVCGFYCEIEGHKYIALVEDIRNLKKREKMALVLLSFIDTEDPARKIMLEANSARFYESLTKLREFFGLPYSNNPRDLCDYLYSSFNDCIPSELSEKYPPEIQDQMEKVLQEHDNDGYGAVHCYAIMRNGVDANGKQRKRTVFNSQRAKLRVPDAYEKVKQNKTLSFCFSGDPERELDQDTLVSNLLARKPPRKRKP